MNKRQLGNSDLFISEISLGCMSLGTNKSHAAAIIDEALESGINYFDTADLYDFGENEKVVGEALKSRRDEIILGTKVGNRFKQGKQGWTWDPSKAHIKEGVKDSLQRLGTDYIDLYQLHGGTIEDQIDETIEAFEDLKKEGLIREYGISSIRPNVIKEFVKKSTIVSVMMQYSALDRRPEEEVLDLLEENNISVIARGPLAKGMLSDHGSGKVEEKGKDGFLDYSYNELVSAAETWKECSHNYPTANSLALKYVLHHPAVATALFGASSIEQLNENLSYLDAPDLSDDLYTDLRKLTKPIKYQEHR